MSRVSESSSIYAIKHAVGRSKSRLEDLQIKGSNLKRVQKPSDDPVANMEILSIRSKNIDGKQYKRNASVAKAQLTFTENAVEELTELLVKAKELAIGQSSNLFDPQVRRSVAQEVSQLHDQSVSIANRRLGNKYIFAGHKTLTKPFNGEGKYLGDEEQTKVEIAKDVFVPITFSGKEIFFEKDGTAMTGAPPLENTPLDKFEEKFEHQTKESPHFIEKEIEVNRTPATQEELDIQAENAPKMGASRKTIFNHLKSLHNALLTDNHEIIQELLPQLDKGIDRLIEMRTKIGSVSNTIDNAVETIERNELMNQEYKSKIEDADVAELFTDLTRQQNVLNATYKASAQMMNRNLMDFIN
jgi:flagellar hook-associated protein 3 FlgL